MTPAEFRAIRRRLGRTVEALARAMGVDRRTIQRWEAEGVPTARAIPGPARILMRLFARRPTLVDEAGRMTDDDASL